MLYCYRRSCHGRALWEVLLPDGSKETLCDEHAAEVKASGAFGTITRNDEPRPAGLIPLDERRHV